LTLFERKLYLFAQKFNLNDKMREEKRE